MPVPTSSEARVAAREHVLRAARACFLATGVRRTTMEAVARSAGTSRQVVYKLFLGRRELVEAAVAERIAELADELATGRWGGGATVEIFTSVSVAVIEGIRADHELGVLLGDGSPLTLHEALWMESVAQRGLRFWLPWFERARSEGLLRDDLSDSDLSDWLQTIYASIILRRNMAPGDERALIERFVLTSLAMASRPDLPRLSEPIGS